MFNKDTEMFLFYFRQVFFQSEFFNLSKFVGMASKCAKPWAQINFDGDMYLITSLYIYNLVPL